MSYEKTTQDNISFQDPDLSYVEKKWKHFAPSSEQDKTQDVILPMNVRTYPNSTAKLNTVSYPTHSGTKSLSLK